jgi:hypothetical protein
MAGRWTSGEEMEASVAKGSEDEEGVAVMVVSWSNRRKTSSSDVNDNP